jgi:YD repeat-containing protein
MPVQNPTARDLKKSVTYMENLSFDPVYEVLTRIPLTMNPVTGDMERTTAIQGNPSMTLAYDGDGNLATMTKTIDGTTYTKTFSWVGGNLTAISAWS